MSIFFGIMLKKNTLCALSFLIQKIEKGALAGCLPHLDQVVFWIDNPNPIRY
jgi:hypothetical protein